MNRRKQARHSTYFGVCLTGDSADNVILPATNFSEDGLYVFTNGRPMPEPGSIVQVKLFQQTPHQQQPLLLDMVIKRADHLGIGLKYLDTA